MGHVFWIRRFLTVFAGAFVVIAAAQLLKGRAMEDAAWHASLWAAAAAAVFTASRLYQSRRGQHCAICKDTPEMLDHDHLTQR
ncbi:MAG: hypothetical protein NDJ94_11950 [Vicinamibacteria bacterium]|jgi:hypothetical protein|nr:hypothetical protein [Vicinamibacteria bacterium]